MPMRSRSRLISFRLTEEEHDLIREKCLLLGERSISHFARNTVLRRAQTAAPVNLGDDLTTISEHLRELNVALHDLSRRIQRALGTDKTSRGPAPPATGDESHCVG